MSRLKVTTRLRKWSTHIWRYGVILTLILATKTNHASAANLKLESLCALVSDLRNKRGFNCRLRGMSKNRNPIFKLNFRQQRQKIKKCAV